ncbi:MAG: GNAT family N-acetyltransferase [Candidatus Fimenecus sp.]
MIKELTKKDIPECVCVIKESFMTVANEFGFTVENAPKFTAFSMNIERLETQYETENRLMFAYFDGGKPIGFYSLNILKSDECELNNLSVLPAYRHKKIGEKMLLHAIKQAKEKNCKIMQIGIVEENKVLCSWYEKFGFIHIGTKKFEFFPFTCGYMKKLL